MTVLGMGKGPLDNLPSLHKRDDVPPAVPGWSSPAGPGDAERPRPGVRLLFLGIIVAVLGWIALSWVNNQAPDRAGLFGAHGVLKNYGLLHTLAIGVIVVGAALALVGVLKMSSNRR